MTKLLITYDTVGADGVRGETCCESYRSRQSLRVRRKRTTMHA